MESKLIQMEIGEIPELPNFPETELFFVDEEFMISEFKKAKNKFVFYDNENNEPRFFFYRLDERLYAALVYILTQKKYVKLYEFLKLVLEGVRLMKQANKKGYETAVRIEKSIQKQNQRG